MLFLSNSIEENERKEKKADQSGETKYMRMNILALKNDQQSKRLDNENLRKKN